MRDERLSLVDLDQDLTGYRQFISSWICRDERVSFVVDPGPRSTARVLIEALRRRGVAHLDLVLLTHVHLDHGGGTAEILEAFPEARVYCHDSGVGHLVDPSRLWAGSLRTIGDVAQTYGEPRPVAADRFITAEALAARHQIRVLPTPGHASHHVCFAWQDVLFAGEAIATYIGLPGGAPYLRPSTPPRFFPDVFFRSLDRLVAIDPEPRITAFAHYGQVDGVRRWCALAREQLQRWLDVARQGVTSGEADLERLSARLRERDPIYGQGRIDGLPPDIRERELHYTRNSLQGLIQAVRQR